jgi:hypothetical protein
MIRKKCNFLGFLRTKTHIVDVLIVFLFLLPGQMLQKLQSANFLSAIISSLLLREHIQGDKVEDHIHALCNNAHIIIYAHYISLLALLSTHWALNSLLMFCTRLALASIICATLAINKWWIVDKLGLGESAPTSLVKSRDWQFSLIGESLKKEIAHHRASLSHDCTLEKLRYLITWKVHQFYRWVEL